MVLQAETTDLFPGGYRPSVLPDNMLGRKGNKHFLERTLYGPIEYDFERLTSKSNSLKESSFVLCAFRVRYSCLTYEGKLWSLEL